MRRLMLAAAGGFAAGWVSHVYLDARRRWNEHLDYVAEEIRRSVQGGDGNAYAFREDR